MSNRLDAIKARADAATPGPWHDNLRDIPGSVGRLRAGWMVGAYEVVIGPGMAARPFDAEFIAHTRTDVPALVAAVEAVLALHQRTIEYPECKECGFEYPCPTVTAIRDALGEDEQ